MHILDEQHKALVSRLAKPAEEILKELTTTKIDLLHMLTGMETEIGEIATTIKAIVFYNKPIDYDNIIEELGDLEFYIQGLRHTLAISRDETLLHNINKLNKRYPDGYNDQSAIKRADKATEIHNERK